jgi:hypothetical protein
MYVVLGPCEKSACLCSSVVVVSLTGFRVSLTRATGPSSTMSAILTGICALSALCVRLYPGPLSSSPIVDLGYNLQQASFLNTQYDL